MAKLFILTVLALSLSMVLADKIKMRVCRRRVRRFKAKCIARGYDATIECSGPPAPESISPKNKKLKKACRRKEDKLVELNCAQCYKKEDIPVDCQRDGVVYHGQGLENIDTDSVEACADQCIHKYSESCYSINYNKIFNHCYIMGYSRKRIPSLDVNWVSKNRVCVPEPSVTCWEEDVAYPDELELNDVDVDQCVQLCSDTASCQAVSFTASSRTCNLRSSSSADGYAVSSEGTKSANVPCV